MPLDSYEDVAAYGKMIQYTTTAHLMPPWYADPSYRHFSNERVLPYDDIQKIKDWVANGLPEGNQQKEITSVNKNIGPLKRQPDLVISMHEAFEQYGIYADQYQVFVLPTYLEEDQWIEGIEFVPGNKKIVRSAVISVEPSDKFDVSDAWDPRYGYYSFGGLGNLPDQPYWYTWSLQQEATFYPHGMAKFLPAKSKFILHIQYGPTGWPQKDSSFIRIYFAKKKEIRQIFTAPLINPLGLTGDSLFIKANAKKTFHASYTIPYDINILSLTPQSNLICRAWEVYAITPGNPNPFKLLRIKDWNFNWRQTFRFESPVNLPKGTIIHALVNYDNTAENLCNPSDKPVSISWGAHLFSELLFLHIEFTTNLMLDSTLQIIVPVTFSDSILTIKMLVDNAGVYRIQISAPDGSDEVIIKNLFLTSGSHYIEAPVTSLALGNYLLRVLNADGVVVAEQMIFKLPGTKM